LRWSLSYYKKNDFKNSLACATCGYVEYCLRSVLDGLNDCATNTLGQELQKIIKNTLKNNSSILAKLNTEKFAGKFSNDFPYATDFFNFIQTVKSKIEDNGSITLKHVIGFGNLLSQLKV
jgi:hypothetical protein